ncbi:asparagine synthase (glutamine-hydrolyzing) [Cylindrospermopsis raciborskii UAM/DH-MRr]|uniref:asparagine synthase (glutamine-hydrolyzing) n=1 Tax=Cylindrospermopsis raciborskii TaxID=77022 RepID=UPI00387A323F
MLSGGGDCLNHLNGMFAFALYDAPNQRLFLSRDRAGEKPLFYRFSEGSLQFASELKSLLANPANPRQINPHALDCYLSMGFVPGSLCILQGYNKLPPAHALTFDIRTGNINIWKYWQLPESPREQIIDETCLVDELENLLENAVARQMVADVPIGILLSGGVDSSLITAMAVRNSAHVRTFSIGFPGHGKLDETPHARLIANYFGTDHTELVAEPASAELIPKLVRQFDEPMVDSSMIPTFIVSRLVRQYCTVAMGGDGGDELFGGYSHYSRMLWMQRNLKHIPNWLGKAVAQMAEYSLPTGFKGRNYLQGLGVNFRNEIPFLASYFDPLTRRRLMRSYPNYSVVAETIFRDRIPNETDLLQRATRMDFNNYLAEDILFKVDRSSMLNSLEVRAPFLDRSLIEFAFGKVPSSLKATLTDKKILLKQLTGRVLPPEFDKKRKQGFSIPLASWLRGGQFRELFWDVLLDQNSCFDPSTVRSLLKGQNEGRNNGDRLFALVQFQLWVKEYTVSM